MSETPDILRRIVARTRADVQARAQEVPLEALRARAKGPTRGFASALLRPGVSLIAELKPRSPSRGALRPHANPVRYARLYEAHAQATSVLCDRPYFGGSYGLLSRFRAHCRRPVLAKDFVVTPYQLYEARAHGADAVLLMASVLDDGKLRELLALATTLSMDALVETHDPDEIERAVAAGARIIGVNARDLRTLQVDFQRGMELLDRVPNDRIKVAESGVQGAAQLRALRGRADAVLVGSAIMAASDPGHFLGSLLGSEPVRPRWVKVCGIRTEAGARACAQAGVDLVGFNFVRGTRREVAVERAGQLLPCLGGAEPVGVFRDAPLARVLGVARRLGLGWVQLHGEASPKACAWLRERGLKVIRAVPAPDVDALERYEAAADLLLLDGATPGSGQRWDLGRLSRRPRVPFLVAGGLHAKNVGEVIRRLEPQGVDVASGVERSGGVDTGRVAAFCQAACEEANG